MIPQHYSKSIFIVIGLLTAFAFYLQYSIGESTKNLKKTEIQKVENYAKRISNYIKDNSQNLSLSLKEDTQTINKLNSMLSVFQTNNFTNLFVLQKSNKDKFRFILDGSTSEPIEYGAIFFPKSREFISVYNTQEAKIIEQQGIVEKVWLSLLYPIVRDGQTEALLVIDLSEEYGKHIKDFNSPLMDTVWMMQLLALVSIIFLGYTAYNTSKLRKRLLVDQLTTANTRQYLREFFESNSVPQFDFILLDIDLLRQINNKHGRDAADILLKEFVQFLKEITPDGAEIIRNSGAEFLIIIPKIGIVLDELAKALFDTIPEKKYSLNNDIVSLTISMSAIDTPKNTNSYYDIQRILDEKMLEIKNTGRDRLIVINDISEMELKYQNVDFVKQAIDSKRLMCLYQPICNTKSKEIVKHEALVRIIDDSSSHEIISPNLFMESIRETTHYLKLSKWVIEEVFSVLQNNPKAEISINMDLVDLYNEEMMKLIEKELYDNRHLANRLTFEILEHHEITDYARVGRIFKQLKSYGSKIAIDDFGSGYSNYAYLIKLDIDILKIDASLIRELEGQNPKAISVVKSINNLGLAHGIGVIAEFVSSQEIHDILVEIGVEFSQGYYLGRPDAWSLDMKSQTQNMQ